MLLETFLVYKHYATRVYTHNNEINEICEQCVLMTWPGQSATHVHFRPKVDITQALAILQIVHIQTPNLCSIHEYHFCLLIGLLIINSSA
jgi:hypothetical protein